MQVIINNPYRTVGLLVGATAAEQRRQLTRLQRFIEAEQEPDSDFSFPTLGQLHRTIESVTEAASKLNLDIDKMNAALFWFYKGNPITDEPALDSLKEADQQSTTQIWIKLTASGEVTQRNSSAFQNLSTLLLCNAFNNSTINADLLEQGISLKLKFLESDFIKDFKALATDETFKTTKKELQLLFLNQVQSEVDKNEGITPQKFLEILSNQSFLAKDDFLNDFVQKPIEQIAKQIDEVRVKRKTNKANAAIIAKSLFEQTADGLAQLKSILGTSNLKFSSISDKVSDEILQCGIDYYSHYKDSSTDPGSASMALFRKAKTLAIGNIAKQRCQENTENLQRWIDGKPDRDKQSKILVDFQNVTNLIDEYEQRDQTVSNAKQLLSSARPSLNNIRNVLGNDDELYLGLSSRIASDAQGMLVSDVNALQEKFSSSYDSTLKLGAILLLRQRVNEAYEVTTSIGEMDLTDDFRTHYTSNRNSLHGLKTQLSNVNTGSGNSSTGSSGGGCYIATMAYGDYDHPQVLILRQFRDNVLDKVMLGKWLVKTYYNYSPMLVAKLAHRKTANDIIRIALNQFIKLIK